MASSSERKQLHFTPAGGSRYVALNTSKAPFDKLAVRQAVATVLDRNAMRLTRGGAIDGRIATHFLDPSFKTQGFAQAGGLGFDPFPSPGFRGNVAKAIAEECGLTRASAIDVKSFCAAPVHAIVVGAALIEAGIEERIVIVAGGSLGKLGMKFEGALAKGFPVLEDVLAGMAVLLEPADGSNGPVVRPDAVGRMPVEAGAAPQAQLEALVGRPLDALGLRLTDVGTYATEIHNPEITEPQGGGSSNPSR